MTANDPTVSERLFALLPASMQAHYANHVNAMKLLRQADELEAQNMRGPAVHRVVEAAELARPDSRLQAAALQRVCEMDWASIGPNEDNYLSGRIRTVLSKRTKEIVLAPGVI